MEEETTYTTYCSFIIDENTQHVTNIDFGDKEEYHLTIFNDENHDAINFVSKIAAINYMSSLGWELISSTLLQGTTSAYECLFKKEVTTCCDIQAGLHIGIVKIIHNPPYFGPLSSQKKYYRSYI